MQEASSIAAWGLGRLLRTSFKRWVLVGQAKGAEEVGNLDQLVFFGSRCRETFVRDLGSQLHFRELNHSQQPTKPRLVLEPDCRHAASLPTDGILCRASRSAQHQSTTAQWWVDASARPARHFTASVVVCRGWALMHPTPRDSINSLRGATRSSECL